MKIVTEISLVDFEFWGGAKTLGSNLTLDELDTIEWYLEELDEMLDETEINDFFWFEDETIAEILEYENADELWDEIFKRIKGEK